MTKICCKETAIPETVKSPLMGILARSSHQILGLIIGRQKSRSPKAATHYFFLHFCRLLPTNHEPVVHLKGVAVWRTFDRHWGLHHKAPRSRLSVYH